MNFPRPLGSIFGLFLVATSAAHAGDPSSLTRACPRLNPIDGAPAGETVIDNKTVTRLANEGRIAAITTNQTTKCTPPRPQGDPDAGSKNYWRKEHHRCVLKIQGIRQQIARTVSERTALRERFFSLRKESQRIRLQIALDAKTRQIDELKDTLKRAWSEFSSTIRRARKAGAQPGWFRDLPRP